MLPKMSPVQATVEHLPYLIVLRLNSVPTVPTFTATPLQAVHRSNKCLNMLKDRLLLSLHKLKVKYDVSIANQQVKEWKSHIVCSHQQQMGKTTSLSTLTDSRGMLIVDWVMRVLPQEYLESSKNWFIKKGI